MTHHSHNDLSLRLFVFFAALPVTAGICIQWHRMQCNHLIFRQLVILAFFLFTTIKDDKIRVAATNVSEPYQGAHRQRQNHETSHT
ncbi:hypothetical protein [Cupriavidus basilensis]|uniref:hypothetical protein n=1 Tax=Cupriavidus basilensis TaxID=68895 RepID=UPI0005BB9618|nr:hypothetical protein [Cupriavidus basilensis]